MQNVLGVSPTTAGLAFVPMALCTIGGAFIANRVARLLQAHCSVGVAMLHIAVGIAGAAEGSFSGLTAAT